ncbi:glycosyltransferase family 1 protein [Bacillus sp. HNR-4]|uniref:glycosyltransferase family 1 protein n=1 Tax=Bacillus sp. HNR-4 TaxID=2796141 RepID=UPI00237947AF|nr:glycosyltransferase family 1 protein [Bacillus sp. HNR-4]WDL92127.1 glycosyltransferase family 1 protein [Bacillus sp. HNR-4]
MTKDNQPKRLLCIVNTINAGGAETFLMKLYRALDKRKYQMDFYCMSLEKGYYEEEIKKLGGKVYYAVPKSQSWIKAFFTLKGVVKENKYEYVMRVSQHSLATFDLIAARMGGAQVLVQRSSNSNAASKIGRVLHDLFRWLPMTIPNVKIAPSTEAAEYTFGKNCVKNGKAILIKNAIPLESFLFNKEKRNKLRKELNLDGKFVVGHVGRFDTQKNHSYLIDIFSEIVKRNVNSILVLTGKGSLENEIKEKVEKLGLIENVIFTGVRSDIPDIMMAMDVFIFPSLYEGMPNTVIEAQGTGLPCIISDTITREADITENIEYLSINEEPEKWAEKALIYSSGYERGDVQKAFVKKGYDINCESKKLMELVTK